MNLPKVPAIFAALALLPAVFFSSCSKHPAPAVTDAAATPPQPQTIAPPPPADSGVDASTPKKASLAFASALVAGDSAGMRSLAVGGRRTFAYYSALADLVASQHIFTATLKSRFGDDCVIPPEIEHIGNLPPMPSNYDQLTEQIDGDSATLVDPSGHPGVRLKKVDGNWKVDLDAADAALPPDGPENMSKQRQQLAATKKGFDQTTAKIFDGTYTDCKSALDGLMAAIGPQP